MADNPDNMNGVDDQTTWKAISLTHVEYPAGDFLGFILAWSSLTPFILLVSFACLIVFRRDLHTIAFFCGLLVNELLNMILKHTIREPRPMKGRENLYTEYGMPSSHSQFMWFFSTYFTLFLVLRLYKNYSVVDDLWKYGSSVLSYLVTLIVSWSRIYLIYHSFSQVLCGALIGSVLSGLWFAAVHLVFTPFFPLIAGCPVGEFLMLRDSTLIPHVLWFEYTCSRSEARSRQRKMSVRKSQ